MRSRRVFIAAISLAIISLLAWFVLNHPRIRALVTQTHAALRPPPSSQVANAASSTSQRDLPLTQAAAFDQQRQIWNDGLRTPISFYGKVVDQNGNAIAGATAEISVNNKGMSGTTVKQTTDAKGEFAIIGAHGLAVAVAVSKAGYYQVKQSRGVYGYAEGMSRDGPLPTVDHPATFVLRAKQNPTRLSMVRATVDLPNDNAPVEVNIATGKTVPAGQGDLRFEYSIEQQPVYHTYTPYYWRLRILAPRGGLASRDDEFAFVAPADGYRNTDEIEMAPTDTSRWRPQCERQYFVKLATGEYARVAVKAITGRNSFVTITGFVNPVAGDRNLEQLD